MKKDHIEALCKIEVIRTGWQKGKGRKKPIRVRRLGNATWIVGVYDLVRDPTKDEQQHIDRATSDLNDRLGSAEEEYDWIRWGKKAKFARECRVGDTLIYIDNPEGGRARVVTHHRPVLLKRTEPNWIRVYLGDVTKDSHEINWWRFQRILREAGYSRKVSSFSVQRVEPEVARIIDRKWTKVR